MGVILLALFIGVPLIEIWLFISVGQQVGLAGTLGLVILTAVLGTILMRQQGLAAWTRYQHNLQSGQVPVDEAFTGLFLLVAGALLLTPGFFTDAIGFALFIPDVRQHAGKAVLQWLMKNANLHVYTGGMGQDPFEGRQRPGPDMRGTPVNGNVIDGDYEDVTRPGEDDRTPR